GDGAAGDHRADRKRSQRRAVRRAGAVGGVATGCGRTRETGRGERIGPLTFRRSHPRSFSRSGEGGAKRRMRDTGGNRIELGVNDSAQPARRVTPHPVLRTTFSLWEKDVENAVCANITGLCAKKYHAPRKVKSTAHLPIPRL